MNQIMISIQPKWVEKILNGEKTIEIRKTMPKCGLPCKVYIYCTKPKKWWAFSNWGATSNELVWKIKDKIKMCDGLNVWDEDCEKLNGKIVAEFTLDKITKHDKNFIDCEDNICYNFKVCDVKNAGFETDCLSLIDFDNFVEDYGKGKTLYAWHIDKLKIYDKPRELSEFYKFKKCNSCKISGYESSACRYDEDCRVPIQIIKPPQSWCYIEEIINNEKSE